VFSPTIARIVEERFLVTGGAGFIGSHLIDLLLDSGHRVTALDDLSTGRLENLKFAMSNPRFRFVHGSVSDERLVQQLVASCDTIAHLAAAVGVKLVVSRPLHSLRTNLRGSEVVFRAASRHRRKTLLTSSSEIYGQSPNPLRESADGLLGPPWISRWGYAISKAANESLAFAYHQERNLPIVVARLFNTVGPRQSPAHGMVIPRLVRQALSGQPLTVYGDGTQTRCFCHVRDVVEALRGLLEDDRSAGQAFNIGSQEEITILELAQRIVNMVGQSAIELVPYEIAYPRGFAELPRRVPDITKVLREIGWSPKRTLDDILTDVIHEAATAG
jgi:UDP-glucose 4-epimerase